MKKELTPLEIVEGHANGTLVLRAYNVILPTRLNAAEKVRFEEAKSLGYAVTTSRRVNLQNVWFEYCKAIDWPFVCVVETPTYATVEMDLIDYSKELTDDGIPQLYEEIRKIFSGAKRWSKGSCGFSTIGAVFSLVKRIPRDSGGTVARAMVDFARKNAVPRVRAF